ncbi:MAG: hypothetical protein U5J95_08320 [Balneolaceae bacterium]|nr:hypothetical protein [Balneolaceae bacterium]
MASQIIESITFDSVKGEYVIQYMANGNMETGFFVPANGVKPSVKATVNYDESLNLFIYNYKIKNEEEAFHPMYAAEVTVDTSVNKIKSPNENWSGRYIQWMSKVIWSKTEGLIPGISPGDTQKGFEFSSGHIPSITNMITTSLTDIYFPNIDEELPYELSVAIDSLRERTNGIKLKTIGPRKLPEDIGHTALLDTLYSYLAFSCDTTWIENQGICRSLEKKLDNVSRQLERGNTKTAANNLQAFLNELQALKEKQLSSEAWALLYYNGQYLLEQLQQPQKDGGNRE